MPTALVLYVTYRCNSRCIMCGIWENPGQPDVGAELSPEELERVLADRLFANIQQLNINGGEPTLREDLSTLVQVAVDRLPRLRRITMSSNGLLPERLVSEVDRIQRICVQENIAFSLALSVHGLAQTSERILGIQGAFDRQVRALAALQEMALEGGLALTLHCVITRANTFHLPELLHWSRERELPISFALGEVRERFLNQGKDDQVRVAAGEIEPVVDFLRGLADERRPSNPAAFRYHHLANMLQSGQRRTVSCHYAMGGVILGSQGELYYCPHSQGLGACRNRSAYEIYYAAENLDYRASALLRNECLRCPPYTFNRLEFEKDILKYLRFLAASRRHNGSREGGVTGDPRRRQP